MSRVLASILAICYCSFFAEQVSGLASPIEGQDTYRLKVAEDTLYVDTLITSDSCKKFTFVVFRALNYVPLRFDKPKALNPKAFLGKIFNKTCASGEDCADEFGMIQNFELGPVEPGSTYFVLMKASRCSKELAIKWMRSVQIDPKTAIYNITVKTSNHRYADADVNGFVRINGVSETDVHIGKNFHRGEIKQRIVELPYQKIVLYIAIRRDGRFGWTSWGHDWHVDWVKVNDGIHEYTFDCDCDIDSKYPTILGHPKIDYLWQVKINDSLIEN
ncbi:uncharacterized protein LOC142353344 [Convolutriloba macropyga]|uniref:uncharacterized protein LOC142353344 n=1 Tax=Convolutriloba macropyga TaxID=536237 RepID=UPI003F51D3D6